MNLYYHKHFHKSNIMLVFKNKTIKKKKKENQP